MYVEFLFRIDNIIYSNIHLYQYASSLVETTLLEVKPGPSRMEPTASRGEPAPLETPIQADPESTGPPPVYAVSADRKF